MLHRRISGSLFVLLVTDPTKILLDPLTLLLRSDLAHGKEERLFIHSYVM
jgi:hypothetical protein